MTAGSYGAQDGRSHVESDAGLTLALVMAGAGASGIAAVATLISGGGFLAAFLVYVLGTSAIVPVLAVAPHARRVVARVRHHGAPRLAH